MKDLLNTFSGSSLQQSSAQNENHYIDLSDVDDLEETELVVEHADSIADGLLLSLNNKGNVDIYYIAKICGCKESEVISELKGSIFLNPIKFNGDLYEGWETKDEYLSGNLSQKFNEAVDASRNNRELFKNNIFALKNILNEIPKLSADEIHVTLGTPWLTPEIIKCFISEVMKTTAEVRHDINTGSWSVTCSYRYGALLNVQYGTKHANAIDIISKTLNQIPIIINKPKFRQSDKPERDENETLMAIEKQALIIETFEKWIKARPDRRKYIENLYNAKYGYHVTRRFDGSFLKMPGMNPTIQLYDYQKNAIARMILTPNTLLLHDVGQGKSYEMIGAAHELRRMNLAKKILFVVPNNILGQWKKMYLDLYPSANILVVEPKKFNPANRNNILNEIIYNDYEAIIMAYSSFNMIELSPDVQKSVIKEEAEKVKESYYNDRSQTSTVKRSFTNLCKGFYEEKILEIGDRVPGTIYFDDLGIDTLFVDEAHRWKNVPIDGNIKVLGINTSGCKQCQMMMDKVHYVQKTHNGGRIIFATATPITNSISDLYNMQRYLQEGDLAALNIQAFSSWIANFAELSQNFEIDVDTSSYRMASRYSKFHNIPELASLLSNIADFHKSEKSQGLPIFKGYTNIVVDMQRECEKYMSYISDRADLIRQRKPMVFKDRGEKPIRDNMLLVTHDGRDVALDIRLVIPNVKFNEGFKVAKCADQVAKIYHETTEKKLTQLIFCDTATPSNSHFNVYNEVRHLLVKRGVKYDEIAFIQDANTEAKKKALFAAVNEGKIRVLLGSCLTLGTGVNVQKKLIAIHHLDICWTPNLMVQALGRIVRQGNENKEVFAYRYITKQSFDAYSWQLLETKQNFISKLLANNIAERQANDIDDSVLSYAEVKALAIGNPLLKIRVETNNELCRLISLRNKQAERIGELKNNITAIQLRKEQWLDGIKKAEQDAEYIHKNVQIESFGESEADLDDISKKANIEKRNDLKRLIFKTILNNASAREETYITDYYGFKVICPNYTAAHDDKFIYLERNGKYAVTVGNSDVGILVRMNNFLKNFDQLVDDLKKNYEERLDEERVSKEEISRAVNYDSDIRELENKLLYLDMKLGVTKEDK